MHCDTIYFCRWLPVFGVTCCIQLEGTKNIQHIPLLTCEVDNLPFHHYKNNLFSFFLFCTNIHIHLNIILYIQVLDLKLSSQITIMTSFISFPQHLQASFGYDSDIDDGLFLPASCHSSALPICEVKYSIYQ
jgi:hypothetical protein